jgi:hypothetical protein
MGAQDEREELTEEGFFTPSENFKDSQSSLHDASDF